MALSTDYTVLTIQRRVCVNFPVPSKNPIGCVYNLPSSTLNTGLNTKTYDVRAFFD